MVRRFTRTRQGTVALTRDYGRDLPGRKPETRSEPETQSDLAGVRLLIVQCDPSTAEIVTRASASEPELAREYVIGALRRSAASGLVIPPIPSQLLPGLAQRLVAGVGDYAPDELIATARALRDYLRKHGGAANEITLFLRELSRL
ncbi:MAG: hypothetical protein E6J91_10095 [Deltaproteobacteria bacterium]|nr:MAG: hypothetical protein E6J91_10095 [Deltaproteobacteria bacterium]